MELKLKEKLENYKRVLMIAKKPTPDEFKLLVKVCGLGILAVGLIGFTIYALSVLFIG